MVLSVDPERSFARDGKQSLVIVDSWCERVPTSRFAAEPATGSGRREGLAAASLVGRGGAVELMWYTFTRASVLPVASVRFEGAVGVDVEAEERARQRMAEA